jgi:hypothetical protein
MGILVSVITIFLVLFVAARMVLKFYFPVEK